MTVTLPPPLSLYIFLSLSPSLSRVVFTEQGKIGALGAKGTTYKKCTQEVTIKPSVSFAEPEPTVPASRTKTKPREPFFNPFETM